MRCFCCDAQIKLARKVKIRRLVDFNPARTTVESREDFTPAELAANTAHKEQMTYRWAVICHACYRILDNELGLAPIGAEHFNIAGASRGDKASIIDEKKYRVWQAREAAKLGLDPE